MLLDVVILPPEKIREKIGKKIKKEIGNLPNFFVVDGVKLIPHLSLWHLRSSKNRIGKLAHDLQQIVRIQKPVKIHSTGFRDLEMYKGDVEFTARGGAALKTLQQKVFETTYPFKTGMMPPFSKHFEAWTGEKLEQAKRYGRPLGFAPHFTMGFLKSKTDAVQVSKRMQKVNFDFVVREIYICEVNNWWQVKKIIRKISFGK